MNFGSSRQFSGISEKIKARKLNGPAGNSIGLRPNSTGAACGWLGPEAAGSGAGPAAWQAAQ
jgi:hypothetical protein